MMCSFCKRAIAIFFLFSFCLLPHSNAEQLTKHSQQFFDVFDTVISFISFTNSDEEYQRQFEIVQSEMRRYHQIFDRYHLYEGVKNLCLLNQQARLTPTQAEPELIDLLQKISVWRDRYTKKVNPALGTVLELWHEARSNGILPTDSALAEASKHCNFDDVVLDLEHTTVSYSDPLLQLDLGAAAKGYAAQLVADTLLENGASHFILNAGGNVICADVPLDGRSAWTIGIEDIDGTSIRHKVYTVFHSVVTSGDYMRYVTIDGVNYHHLIDPDTLFPAAYSRAVTIICKDSGLADFLSTAVFLLPPEEGRKLIDSIEHCEAFWILNDNSEMMTDGFSAYLSKP